MDILFPRSTVESQAEVWTHRPTDPPHDVKSNPTQDYNPGKHHLSVKWLSNQETYFHQM